MCVADQLNADAAFSSGYFNELFIPRLAVETFEQLLDNKNYHQLH